MECIRRPLCLIALAVILMDICLLRLGVFDNTPYVPGSFVNVTGEVTAVKNMEYGVGYYLNNGIYVISDSGSEISVGDKLSVYGVVKEFQEPRNDGQFNQKLYYRSIGITCQVKAKEISAISCSNLLSENISQIKDNISDIFDKIAQGEDSAVLKAVILGDKSCMDKDYYSLYQRNGIAHLLAISGVKTLKLDIPLVPETRINWTFVPLHIAIIYILKLCLDEEIIPRCRFTCSRGYLTKYIN